MSAASSSHRLRAALGLGGLLSGELLAAWGLHALAALPGLASPLAHPAGVRAWLALTPPPDALVAVARLLASGLVWWLLASTLLSIFACVVGWRPARTAAAALSAPAVRRLVDRALAGMLAASVALAPVATARAGPAAGAPAVTSPAVGNRDAALPPVPLPPVWRGGSAGEVAPSDGSSTSPPPDTAVDATAVHVLRPGEHLWALAERTVRAGRPAATTPEVAAYWRVLVEANRAGIRSGDPDLVFPGERIVLPQPRDSPTT